MPQCPTLTFHDGRTVAQLGYRVGPVGATTAEDLVSRALAVGYRHLHLAAVPDTEDGAGRAIAASGLTREELFVTSHRRAADQAPEGAARTVEASVERLGVEHLDLALMHQPPPSGGDHRELWEAFAGLRNSGTVRSIGVSQFDPDRLQELIDATAVVPVVHAVELHPYFNQDLLRQLHTTHGIRTAALSPLGQGGDLLQDTVLGRMAARHEATPAQLVIAWHTAIGNITLPTARTPEHLQQNHAALAVELDPEEIEVITGLTRGLRLGTNPATRGED